MVSDYLSSLPYDRQPSGLYEPIRYVLSMGGKRIRPSLMLMAYNLYKENPEAVLPQACALETYHNFTLLHDDLMDNADMRRGHQTVHRKWNANTAILSGDTMLILSFHRMMQCPEHTLKAVMETFTETTLEIDEGQQMDIDFETRDDVQEEEYIEMIRLKTSVLLACALKIGAIGKAIGGDILCNKKTYMLINALNAADESQRKELLEWIDADHPDAQQKIAAVTALYNIIGVDKMAQAKIEQYFAEARACLEEVNVESDRKQVLRDYTDAMMHRNK